MYHHDFRGGWKSPGGNSGPPVSPDILTISSMFGFEYSSEVRVPPGKDPNTIEFMVIFNNSNCSLSVKDTNDASKLADDTYVSNFDSADSSSSMSYDDNVCPIKDLGLHTKYS